jgi:uncharacterized protein (TIGR03118 family)
MSLHLRSCFPAVALAAAMLGPLASPAMAQHYLQTNLTADQSGVATNTDPNLVNPWGLSRASGSPWWISDNGTGLSTLYNAAGVAQSLVVAVPTGDPSQSPSGTPTGTVFAGGANFMLPDGKPALFMWVTEDGTVSGWNPSLVPITSAVLEVNTKSKSVFKGAALATVSVGSNSATMLYVADFRKGRIQVFDESFNHVSWIEDAFADDEHNGMGHGDDNQLHIPHGYAPFNVQNIGGEIYVTFAQQDSAKHDEVDGPGLGYVAVFSPWGKFLRQLEHGSWLNGPWALAMAPGDFGPYSHNLLVGQFGSGNIAVYDPVTGRFKGLLMDKTNNPIMIDGLWALSFAGGGNNGTATTLYFSAGSDGEAHGLFGTITPVENTAGNSN